MVQKFSRLESDLVIPIHLNLFSHSSLYYVSLLEPLYSTDSLPHDFHFCLETVNHLVRQHFLLVLPVCQIFMPDAGDIAVSQTDMELTVLSAFCASPQEEEPQNLMCQSLTS